MGFPVGYSELPKLVLHLLFLLSHLRRISTCLLRLTGLLHEDDLQDKNHHHHRRRHCLDHYSPAVRFDSLLITSSATPPPEACCAVCLGDFHAAAEVRRARGCRHVFHRACLDRWAAHGQHTCPLCRAPLLPPPQPSAGLPLPVFTGRSDYYY